MRPEAKRVYGSKVDESWEIFKETWPFSPGRQPLNNVVEGIQISQ